MGLPTFPPFLSMLHSCSFIWTIWIFVVHRWYHDASFLSGTAAGNENVMITQLSIWHDRCL